MLPQEVRTEEAYHSLRRRQIFIWVFLVLLTVSIVGGIFSVAYQVIKSGGNQNRSIANTPVIRPVVGGSDVSENKKEESKDYFIFGELASSDKKYRLYKIRTQPFSKEEIFSFPWSDPKTLPEVTVQGGLIGVFFEPGKGLLLHPDGKVVGTSELAFQPPYAYFSISPDGTRMIYFKYFSSIGTTSLTVRDVKTNEDVFGWPIGSEASRPCEFIGWSQDGRKAYCVAMVKSRADVKSFDV
ncbi:hypothetical protein HYR65_04100, partial [Candidatus Azambacteria bacterium]|nr:hypothetical protein [Candidatus Azambacteria bacterium]